MDSNGIMLFACLALMETHYLSTPPLCLKCMKLGHAMIKQCSGVLLIVLVVCVCSALQRTEQETWEIHGHDGRSCWKVPDNSEQGRSIGWRTQQINQTMLKSSEQVGLLIAWLKAINHYDTRQLWSSLLCMMGPCLLLLRSITKVIAVQPC